MTFFRVLGAKAASCSARRARIFRFCSNLLLGLSVSGIVLFAFCESALRIAAFFYQKKIFSEAREKSVNSEHYTILCVGESTTRGIGDNSWPDKLENRLNSAKLGRKYSAVNLGAPAVWSSYFVDNIDSWISLYQPDLLVTMIGINDDYNLLIHSTPVEEPSFVDSLKTIRLIRGLFKSYIDKYLSKPSELLCPELAEVLAKEPIVELNLVFQDLYPPPHIDLPELDGFSEPPEILRALKLRRETDPENPAILHRLLSTYQMLSDYQGQIEVLFKLIEVDKPKRASRSATFLAGILTDVNDDIPGAVAVCKTALELDPTNLEALTILSRHADSTELLKEVQFKLEEAERLWPENEQLIIGLITVCRRLSKPDAECLTILAQGEERLKRMISENPNNHRLYKNLASLYLVYDKRWAVIAVLEQAILKFPKSYKFLEELGDSYYFLEQYPQAIATYRKLAAFERHREELKSQKSFEQFAISLLLRNKRQSLKKFLEDTGQYVAEVNSFTEKNYRLIAETAAKRGVPHIAVQYPTLPVGPLEQMLKDYPGIIIIGNEDNFQTALQKHDYEEIFSDAFANSFGHMTHLGHDILAERLEQTIREKVLGKPLLAD